MGWIVLKAGGSLTDGHDKELTIEVSSNASRDEHQAAFVQARAFVDECEAASETYNTPVVSTDPTPATDAAPEVET